MSDQQNHEGHHLLEELEEEVPIIPWLVGQGAMSTVSASSGFGAVAGTGGAVAAGVVAAGGVGAAALARRNRSKNGNGGNGKSRTGTAGQQGNRRSGSPFGSSRRGSGSSSARRGSAMSSPFGAGRNKRKNGSRSESGSGRKRRSPFGGGRNGSNGNNSGGGRNRLFPFGGGRNKQNRKDRKKDTPRGGKPNSAGSGTGSNSLLSRLFGKNNKNNKDKKKDKKKKDNKKNGGHSLLDRMFGPGKSNRNKKRNGGTGKETSNGPNKLHTTDGRGGNGLTPPPLPDKPAKDPKDQKGENTPPKTSAERPSEEPKPQETNTKQTKGNGMGRIADAAETYSDAVRNQPLENTKDMETTLSDLSTAEETIAKAKAELATRIEEEFPADGSLVEAINEQSRSQRASASGMSGLGSLFKRKHLTDYVRFETPRRQEQKLDYRAQEF